MTTIVPLTMEIAECQALGEAEAFTAMVRQHQGMVFSIAYHFLGDRAQAEDIAQEVFLRLSGRFSTLESPDHLRFWLRKVTSRLCIDDIRRRPSRRLARLEEVPEPASEDGIADVLVSDRLRRMVAALPEAARMAIILRYQEDMEPAEIAETLNASVHTVKSRLQRALAALRNGFGLQGKGVQP